MNQIQTPIEHQEGQPGGQHLGQQAGATGGMAAHGHRVLEEIAHQAGVAGVEGLEALPSVRVPLMV